MGEISDCRFQIADFLYGWGIFYGYFLEGLSFKTIQCVLTLAPQVP